MPMSTFFSRPRHGAVLCGIAAAGLLALTPHAARAQNGTPGTNGSPGSTLSGSFTFNSPAATFQGTPGGQGGDAGSPGRNGGVGGVGGVGLAATGANAAITILSGSFIGGAGGAGGMGTTNTAGGIGPNGAGGTGGFGGDAFAALGAGSNITILGGNFSGGQGGTGGNGNGSTGGNGGNDLSVTTGVTASVYGGSFVFMLFGGQGGQGPPRFGAAGNAFSLNGGNITVYGTFQTQQFGGTPITTPTTFTNTNGAFFGTLADNSGPGQEYSFRAINGGTLTLAAPPAVPEASTTVSFGLLLALGLGGLVIAAKRKQITP